MKAVKSKAQERKEIENQIRFFLQHGGRVDLIDNGVSGRAIGSSFSNASITFNQPREQRTLLVNEVKAIDARKSKPNALTRTTQKTTPKPRKVLITDDFGEPLRWSWQDS